MTNNVFKFFTALFILLVLIHVYGFFPEIINEGKSALHTYYENQGFAETSSRNLVTGIYLDYRLFDSVFEALLLLITTLGIIFIREMGEDLDG